MNTQQKHLLNLLKEINDICKKYSITYYTAGGTVIGAARHGGFIPWDDDVDLYMDKKNFQLFREAFKKENLPDRKLEFKDDNPDFHATIPRYNEETTTQICRYHVLGKASGGLLIDMLIMDDFPDDYESRHEYLAKLNVYADLIAIPYTHAQRNEDKYLDYFNLYMDKVNKNGRESVIKELEDDLFNYNPEECSDYILRWAALPIILPKKMMGEPVWMPFEDMMIPVPEDWYGYLTLLYGSDWVNVPYNEGQEVHMAVSSMDVPYKVYMAERDKYISQEKALNTYLDRKKSSIDLQYVRRPIEKFVLDLKLNIDKEIFNKKLFSRKDEILDLYEKKSYEEIVKIFDVYIQRQTMTLYAGRLKHAFWNRWINPVVIEIEDWALNAVLKSLIMTGNDKKASQIVSVYSRAGIKNDVINSMDELIKLINHAESLYYAEKYSECIDFISTIPEKEDSLKCRNFYWLSTAKADPCEATLKAIEKIVASDDTSVEMKKAYGDVLLANERKAEAEKVYTEVMKLSRNGMFWNDIRKNFDIEPEVKADSKYTPGPVEEREIELLNEIHDICEKNNIDYVLNKKMTSMALFNGRLSDAGREKTVYMTVENALKFMDAFEKTSHQHRELRSWKADPDLTNFKLIYNDTESVCARFDRLGKWHNIGVHINIVILRKKAKNTLKEKMILFDEVLLNISNIDTVDLRIINKFSRRIIYKLSKLIMKIRGKGKFAEKLFDRIVRIDSEKDEIEGYFIRKNKTKHIYTDVDIDSEFIENINSLVIDGKKYKVSDYSLNNIEEDDVQTKGEESLFVFENVDINWRQLDGLIDYDKYNSFCWREYGQKRNKLAKINKNVKHMWHIMTRAEDRVSVYRKIEAAKEELKIAFAESDYEYINSVFNEYYKMYTYYAQYKMFFYVNDEINNMFCKYLKYNDKNEIADSVSQRGQKMSEDEKNWHL